MDNNNETSQQVDPGSSASGRKPCLSCGEKHPFELDCHPEARDVLAAARDEVWIGRTVGQKYRIVSLLGQGGMSRVYKAIQLPINRVVALKMLLAHLTQDKDSVRRFLQEAQSAGQVAHPNVVSIIDFGIAEDKLPYLVMDYLEGDTICSLLKKVKKLHYKEAVPIFVEACDGLAAAHEHGVIHRDIKPSNIVLQRVPEGQRVRVVDFGIAKMIDADAQQHLTKTGEVFGSPLYMSPEQCEGRALDKRSDIYSLGIVFYEVLTGVVPLAGKTPIETMSLHLQGIPQSLQKTAGPAADIPLALENIVFKMLESNRDKRYADMAEVRRDLKQVEAGDTEVLSGNISLVRREISRRSKFLAAAMVSVFVIGLISVIAYPNACRALADQEYARAKSAIESRRLNEAEIALNSAEKLSRQAGDRGLESRVLGSLVQVYRASKKPELMAAARQRRQELIRDLLQNYDITNDSVEHLLSADKNTVNDSRDSLALGNAGGVSNSLEESSGPARLALQSTRRRAEHNSLSGGARVLRAAASSAGKLAVPQLQGAAGPLSLKEEDSGSAALDSSSADLRKLKPGSGSGGTALASLSSGDSFGDASYGGAVLQQNMPARAPGLPAAEPGASSRPLKVKGMLSRRVAAAETEKYVQRSLQDDDMLDHLQVVSQMSLEKNLFIKARTCADKAIELYESKHLQPDAELSRIYSTKAWSCLKLGDKVAGLDNSATSLALATKCESSHEEAVARGVQAVAYLLDGQKEKARECYGEVCQQFAGQAQPGDILDRALKTYAEMAK